MKAIPADLACQVRSVTIDETATERLVAIYHRNLARCVTNRLDEAGQARVKDVVGGIRRLTPAMVHALYKGIAGMDTTGMDAAGAAPWLTEARATGPAQVYAGRPDVPWLRDGLDEALHSLGWEKDAGQVLTALPPETGRALELAQQALRSAWPQAWAEHNNLVRYLVYVQAPLRSATVQSTFGAIYAEVGEASDPLRMFELLLHESGHHALALREQFTRFLDNPEATGSHALRPDPRPLRGVLHAAFVSYRMAGGLSRYLDVHPAGGPLDGCPVEEHLDFARTSLQQALAVLDDTAEWTPDGVLLRASLEPRGVLSNGRAERRTMTVATAASQIPAFGIDALALAERVVDSGSPGRRWQFSAQWEMLELADGSLFFDSVSADHRTISAPSQTLRRILRLVEDGTPTLESVAEQITGDASVDTVSRIERLLQPLMRAGILVPLRTEERPPWADDGLVERFSTQLEWLGALSAEPQGHWQLFGRLREASVAVLGLGGAGSLLAQALTAAGIGRLTLVDGDTVENSNLVRQILYHPDQAGQGKADSLAGQLRRFSPYTQLRIVPQYIRGRADVENCIEGADFVAVCADAPRFVLNRWIDAACKERATPYLGAFAGSVGPMYRPGDPGCFSCVEHRLREELGDRHDMVVDALAAKPVWRYPAFVSGPLAAAQLMTTEIVLHLTGVAPPPSVGGFLRIKHPQVILEPFPGHPACDCSATPETGTAAHGGDVR